MLQGAKPIAIHWAQIPKTRGTTSINGLIHTSAVFQFQFKSHDLSDGRIQMTLHYEQTFCFGYGLTFC